MDTICDLKKYNLKTCGGVNVYNVCGCNGQGDGNIELAADLTTETEGKALDATMGKELNEKVEVVSSDLNELGKTVLLTTISSTNEADYYLSNLNDYHFLYFVGHSDTLRQDCTLIIPVSLLTASDVIYNLSATWSDAIWANRFSVSTNKVHYYGLSSSQALWTFTYIKIYGIK